MTFRANTVVRTRGGRPVEIVAVLSPDQQASDGDCIVGVLIDRLHHREILTWHRDGTFDPSRGTLDLDLELPQVAAVAREVVHV